MPTPSSLVLLLGSAVAWAYESDQLTSRLTAIDDGDLLADPHADELLLRAAVRANAQGACSAPTPALKEQLAALVHREMGGVVLVPGHGDQPRMSFGAYAAWLESGPVPRHSHADRGDLYGQVPVRENLLLSVVGPASTVRLGGVLLGTDKIDHFWVQGYDYYQRSHAGLDPARAVEWGTSTEWGIWGVRTTGIFSYSDLAANHAGFRFYDALLSARSPLQRDEAGCVALARPFRWADWIDWQLDEVLNPSVYRLSLAEGIREVTMGGGGGPCGQAEPLLTVAEQALLQEALQARPVYAAEHAPSRATALTLPDLCPGLLLGDIRAPRRPDALPRPLRGRTRGGDRAG